MKIVLFSFFLLLFPFNILFASDVSVVDVSNQSAHSSYKNQFIKSQLTQTVACSDIDNAYIYRVDSRFQQGSVGNYRFSTELNGYETSTTTMGTWTGGVSGQVYEVATFFDPPITKSSICSDQSTTTVHIRFNTQLLSGTGGGRSCTLDTYPNGSYLGTICADLFFRIWTATTTPSTGGG